MRAPSKPPGCGGSAEAWERQYALLRAAVLDLKELLLSQARAKRDTERAMSQENVELLRRAFEHVGKTGEILPEAVHPDFVWDVTTFRGAVIPGTFVGVEEINEWLAEWLEGFEDWSIDIEEAFDAGDMVVTIVRQRGKARHGGPPVEQRLGQVWTFRDGLIARMDMYADREDALKAAGLGE